ncbi:MAG TPA: M12 family metallopeptidase, partial [Nitrospiraceae bacterium]|nr:M12 family metallopeptidase [Nitrospiraceae bacterium]
MGSTVKEEHLRWFGRTIPYVIDSSVENLRRFIEGDTATTGAVQLLQEQTHLRFVVRSHQNDYIRFIHGEACSSPYGRHGGRQDVKLNKHTCDTSDAVVHEIAHAIGMRHEHSRRDRDRFVNVHWENIEDGKQHWFEKHGASEGSEHGLYDFSSVMHYQG